MYNRRKQCMWLLFSFIMIIFLAVTVTPSEAQAQEDCILCHRDQTTTLEQSVHSFLSCASCHSDIKGYPHPAGAAVDKKESVATCTGCHEGVVKDSYAESFHGKAVHLGSQTSATCTSCHGTHDILGPANPASKVAVANIPATCASCHDQASPGFAQGKEHFELTSSGDGAPMYYTAKFFTWLTLITVTLLVIHIELQLYHNLRIILRERKRR